MKMAADGGMGEMTDPRKGGRFSYAPVLQAVGKIGYYDDSARDEEFGLAPGRGQDFAFIATIETAGGRTFLQIDPLTTPLVLLTNGVGASGSTAGLPGTQTDAETSAGKDGGVVRNNATFVSVGLMVRRLAPWTTPAAATDVLASRVDADYLGGNALNYGARLQAQVEQACSFLMDVQGGTRKRSQEHLGPICDWQVAQPNGPGLCLPGHFWLFSSDYGSGGQSSDMELTMTAEMIRTIQVEQNAGNPFLAGTQVVVPFRLQQIGYTLCGTPENLADICATPRAQGPSLASPQFRQMLADASREGAKAAVQEMRAAGMLR